LYSYIFSAMVCYFVRYLSRLSSAYSALNGGVNKFISGTGKVTSGNLGGTILAAEGAPKRLLSSIFANLINFLNRSIMSGTEFKLLDLTSQNLELNEPILCSFPQTVPP